MPAPDMLPAIKRVNAQLRAVHGDIRTLERQLALVDNSARGPVLKQLDRAFASREKIMRAWAERVLAHTAGIGALDAAKILGVPVRTSKLLAGTIARIKKDAFKEIAGQTPFLQADTKRLLREIVKEQTELHVKRGLSIPESRRIIASRMDKIGLRAFIDKAGRAWKPGTYAEMAIRTRTAIAYNAGTITQAKAHGVERFEVFDGTSDDPCATANGQIWTGEQAAAEPIAHPNAVLEGTEIVTLGRIEAGYAARWSGPIVRIRTAAGSRLAVTPNHPVLTSRGWLAAKLLKPGDEVLRRTDKRSRPTAAHLEKMPALVEDLLAALRQGRTSTRAIPAAEDLHGDAIHIQGEVEAVDAQGGLASMLNAALFQQPREPILEERCAEHPGFTSRRTRLFRGERIPLATPSRMGRTDVGGIVAAGSQDDATLAEAISDDAIADASLASELERRYACEVTLDEIIDVEHDSVSGHVYDLTTTGRAYFAAGIVISNCTRAFGPVQTLEEALNAPQEPAGTQTVAPSPPGAAPGQPATPTRRLR